MCAFAQSIRCCDSKAGVVERHDTVRTSPRLTRSPPPPQPRVSMEDAAKFRPPQGIGQGGINRLREVAFIARYGVLPPGRLPRWFEFDWKITDAGKAWLVAHSYITAV